jgi:glycosyltransferase involved in cell wall biosynthesis
MDYDLWVRMASIAPFTKRLDKTLAYYRMYDVNKTAKHPIATQRECGRVFRRTAMILSKTEHKFSFIIPARTISSDISQTMLSLAAQRIRDFEVIFVDYSGSKEFKNQLRDVSLELAVAFDHTSIRFISASNPDLCSAINTGIEAACAPSIVTLQEGDTVGPEFLVEAATLFLPDCQGLALPLSSRPDLQKMLSKKVPTPGEVEISSIFRLPYFFPNFVASKVALLDLGGLKYPKIPPLALREIIAHTVHKSWAVNVDNTLPLTPANQKHRDDETLLAVMEPWINARILQDLDRELKTAPFARVRLESGSTFAVPELLAHRSHEVLSLAPPDWEQLQFLENRGVLEDTCKSYPRFAPVWYFMARLLEQQADHANAAEARHRFEDALRQQQGWY